MTSQPAAHVLTINTGSSSLKSGLYAVGQTEQTLLFFQIERIGLPEAHMKVTGEAGQKLADETPQLPDHEAALQLLVQWLRNHGEFERLAAVGHRVVHGGSKYREPQRITPELIAALRDLVPIDPAHLPQAIGAIETMMHLLPKLPQVACFDTAFHRDMPEVAQTFPLPRALTEEGVIRYGFHGLSYEYIMQELRRLDPEAARGRVVIAHLGNGASMAAVRDGRSIDTTMGFTPTGGLMMGTRSGDLDPGVLLYLLEERHMSSEAVNELVNKRSGLVGVSGRSSDMHDLLGRQAQDPASALAVDLFSYLARKYLGALSAALGGLDTLVFTGGIGEHAAAVRERICRDLDFIGIELDENRNHNQEPVISTDRARVTVRVIPTNEDLTIARHTYHVINEAR